jgi:hydroxyacylglutathione hydrolase
VGYERRYNDALRIKKRERFVAYMQDDQPVKPANILNIVAINQGKRPLTPYSPTLTTQPLTVPQVEELMASGHALVDARESADYGAGHIPGAYNVQLSSSEFEQRVGWVVPDNTPIILVAETAESAQTALYKMAFIGLDQSVVGYLEGGVAAWMAAGKPLQTVPQIDVHSLRHRLSRNGLRVLDVRGQDEWDDGHIEGAHRMRYTDMAPQLDVPAQIDKLPFDRDDPIAVTCATGMRSSTAISMLLRHGFTNLHNVQGGMTAWEQAGFPMLDGEGQLCNV